MFVSAAYAQAAGAASAAGGGIEAFLPLILIFVVFYFLLIRPQQKKMKQQREMLVALRRGDKVVTGGGFIGTVTKVDSETEVTVEIAEGVRVRVVRGTIADVLSKPDPAAASAAAAPAPGGLASGLKGLFGGNKDKVAAAPSADKGKEEPKS